MKRLFPLAALLLTACMPAAPEPEPPAPDGGLGCAAGDEGCCGNGVVDEGEDCDDGADNSDAPGNRCDNLDDVTPTCREDCTRPRCGDGIVDEQEACDDGNDDDSDGCHNCMTDICCGFESFNDAAGRAECPQEAPAFGDPCDPVVNTGSCAYCSPWAGAHSTFDCVNSANGPGWESSGSFCQAVICPE